MSDDYLSDWALSLQQSHFKGIILSLVEGAGPLKVIVSQVLFSTSPFLSNAAQSKWQKVAEMLDNETESQRFASLLREGKVS